MLLFLSLPMLLTIHHIRTSHPYTTSVRTPRPYTTLVHVDVHIAVHPCSIQQQINGVCLSPTNPKHKRPHPPDLKRTKSQGTRKLQKGYSSSSQSIEDSDFSGGAMLQLPFLACFHLFSVSSCFFFLSIHALGYEMKV